MLHQFSPLSEKPSWDILGTLCKLHLSYYAIYFKTCFLEAIHFSEKFFPKLDFVTNF
jgi:hypothetical protein